MNPAPSALTIHIFSFGYKYSGIPSDSGGHGGGYVFDCRALPNPHWEAAIRAFKGNEAPVIEYMEAHPEVEAFASAVAALVLYSARVYRNLERERLMVSFGCTGGRHRSVYQAERLATALGGQGFRVALEHLDIDRTPGEPIP